MEKEGKLFFIQKKYIKEVPYLLSLTSDASIACDSWVRSNIFLNLTILGDIHHICIILFFWTDRYASASGIG